MSSLRPLASVSTSPLRPARYCTFTGSYRGVYTVFDTYLNRSVSTASERDALEECRRLNAEDLAKPRPRYEAVRRSEGWMNVIDNVELRIVGYYYDPIAIECAQKLNAAEAVHAKSRPLFPVSQVRQQCGTCGANVITEGDAQAAQCRDCDRMAADSTLAELLGHAKALRDGSPPFDKLRLDERIEQLNALIGDVESLPDEVIVDLAARCAEAIALRLHSIPIRTMVNADRGDLLYDSQGYQPTDSERDVIESQIEVTEDNVPPVEEVPVYNLARFRAQQEGFEPRPAA